jgi:two-component system alkaline phosphatase synthesis response regulator PhoP
VSRYLEQAGYRTLAAHDGDKALALMRSERPDLLVLDLMLPPRGGWDIVRCVRGDATLGGLPIILLTPRLENSDRLRGLQVGADDYVVRPFNPREVVTRVRGLLRQRTSRTACPQIYQVGGLLVDVQRREVQLEGQPVELTPTEFGLLRAMVESPGQAFTRSELIREGLGYAHDGQGRTVDCHVKNLRRKIEANPRQPRYIRTVYGVGYRLVGEA